MSIFSSTTQAMLPPQNKFRAGFSLIEILVTLFIIVLVFSLASNINFTNRHALEEALEKFERAVRFSQGESALRNAMVRIHFDLDKGPQTWSVEYGPDDRFVIPIFKFSSDIMTGLKEQEDYKRVVTTTNKSFNKIKEFQDKEESVPDSVKIIGIGSVLEKRLITQFETSIYFYPSGEKDDALIILATDNEIVALFIDAYGPNIKRQYIALEGVQDAEKEEKQDQLAKEIFESWRKE